VGSIAPIAQQKGVLPMKTQKKSPLTALLLAAEGVNHLGATPHDAGSYHPLDTPAGELRLQAIHELTEEYRY